MKYVIVFLSHFIQMSEWQLIICHGCLLTSFPIYYSSSYLMLEGEWYCKWDKISQASWICSLQAVCGSFVFIFIYFTFHVSFCGLLNFSKQTVNVAQRLQFINRNVWLYKIIDSITEVLSDTPFAVSYFYAANIFCF